MRNSEETFLMKSTLGQMQEMLGKRKEIKRFFIISTPITIFPLIKNQLKVLCMVSYSIHQLKKILQFYRINQICIVQFILCCLRKSYYSLLQNPALLHLVSIIQVTGYSYVYIHLLCICEFTFHVNNVIRARFYQVALALY